MRPDTTSPNHPRRRGVLRLLAACLFAVGLLVPTIAAAEFEAHPLVDTPSATVLFVIGEALTVDPAGDPDGGASVDHQVRAHLSERFRIVEVVDEELVAADLSGIDAVVLSASTSAEHFRPFMLKATTPIVAVKPSSWTALGMAPFDGEDATPLQEASSIVLRDVAHPITADLDDTVSLFADETAAPIGRGWTADSIPADGPLVLGDGADGAALFVYTPGDVLDFAIVDAGDPAASCRVAFPGHGSTPYSDAGLQLLTRAVVWSTSVACAPAGGTPLTPSLDAAMCTVDPADERRALVGGALVDIDPEQGRPNLSSLWVRALAHDAETDVLYVGGRFDRAYDAADRDPDTGAPGDGVDRDGLFACDLRTGTVTDFQVPLQADSLGVTDAGTLRNDRVRALALHGDHLYVGGRFTFPDDLDLGDIPVRTNGVHNLVRVDRRTGELDLTWTADVRGGVSAIVVHGDHLYVSGGIHTVGVGEAFAPASRLARLDLDTGSADDTFLPLVIPSVPQADGSLFASVSAMELIGDILVIGGSFEHVVAAPTTDDWITYASTVASPEPVAWPAEDVPGERRNSVAAFDLSTEQPTLTAFAPSLGDNNLAGGDVTAQIKDLASDGVDSVFVCGDWWLTHPEPGRIWTPYDADGLLPAEALAPPEPPDPDAEDRDAVDEGEAEDAEAQDAEPDEIEPAGDGAIDAPAPLQALVADPNDPGWEGQRSLHQPRPNQHNIGRFDLASGASARTADGGIWGATTDGGVQACDYDADNDLLFIGGHHESIGSFDPDFVDDPNVERYPASHRPLEKANAIDASTGAVRPWDPDLDSVRGVDAVLVLPATDDEPTRVVVGGAFTSSDRMPSEGLAMHAVQRAPEAFVVEDPAVGLAPAD